MTIELDCPCGTRLRLPVEAAGKKAKCPKCGALTRVPGRLFQEAPVTAELVDDDPLEEKPTDFELKVVGEAPTKSEDVKEVRFCPHCMKEVLRVAFQCPHCHKKLKSTRRVDLRMRPSPRRPASTGGTKAWEVWIVLFLLGISVLSNLALVLQKKGSPVPLVLGILMFLGILGRTNWGWWLTTILGAIGVLGCLWLASTPLAKQVGASPFLHGSAVIWTVAIALLIVCRSRGAYD